MIESYCAQWFAFHVRSRHEKSVSSLLEMKHFEPFLPLYPVPNHRTERRTKAVFLPLFPGYVFCRFLPHQRSAAMSTSGIIDLVRIGRDPAPVSDPEIEAIRRIGASGLPVEPYSRLVIGDRVRLIRGALSGLSGVLRNVRNSLRLVISVELLCRSVMVEVDQDMIAPLNLGSKNTSGEIVACA
jgi:transcription antitermination factor NusG